MNIKNILKNIKRFVTIFSIILTLLGNPLGVFAADTDIDPDFDAGTGINLGTINDAILQSDGKIIIVGTFTSFNGDTSLVRIARLNSDGSIDDSFDPGTGANSTIEDVFVQDDGKILIGGSFTTYNGVTRNRIALLNSDGTLDTSFDPGDGPNTTVRAIDVQADDQIIIGGSFITYGGVNKKYAARLNTDGTLDTSFAQTSNEIFDTVTDVHVLSDQKVVITGWFTGVSGTNRGRIARLLTNGNNDTSFGSGTFGYGASHSLSESKILSDGKIVVVGDLVTFDNVSRRKISVVNSNGFLNTDFNPGANGADNNVATVAVQADGKYLIGGSFTNYYNTSRKYVARVNVDGTLDSTFNTATGTDTTINKILVQSDAKILVMGNLNTFNGVSVGSKGITRLVGPDITAPTLQTAIATSTTLTLTYNEDLDEASVPDTADFTVSINGSTSTPSVVTVASSTVELTLSPGAGYGDTVTISYSSSTNPIQDEAGNDAGNLTNQAVTNNTPDTTAPILQTVTASSTQMVLTYDEALDEASIPDLTDFSVSIDGSASTPTAIDVSSTTVTLTLSPLVEYGDVVTISYTKGANPLQDGAGNDVSNLTNQAVTNNTSEVPEIIAVAGSTITGYRKPQVQASKVLITPPMVFGPTTVLRIGDTDTSVKALQKLLNRFNFTLSPTGPGSPGNETDYFGPLTEQALMKLQKTFNLPIDGVYGGETKVLLDDIIQLLTLIGII